ncbi:MAG: DUF134 domain-containing protein [Bacteroidales bacterium]|jgi:predicted DNA-binding protein (UPF0251 family)|nr:DUF134 domain-containing protein [Bacteroidales bacterium]
MPRPLKTRFVCSEPAVSGFRPYGGSTDGGSVPVVILCEEYEALRLSDYEGLSQMQAAGIMQVSRPTFTRIYISARKKIAAAFVEGRSMSIEGGKVIYNDGWYVCGKCGCKFESGKKEPSICPLCGGGDCFRKYDPVGEIKRSAGFSAMRGCGCGKRKCLKKR